MAFADALLQALSGVNSGTPGQLANSQAEATNLINSQPPQAPGNQQGIISPLQELGYALGKGKGYLMQNQVAQAQTGNTNSAIDALMSAMNPNHQPQGGMQQQGSAAPQGAGVGPQMAAASQAAPAPQGGAPVAPVSTGSLPDTGLGLKPSIADGTGGTPPNPASSATPTGAQNVVVQSASGKQYIIPAAEATQGLPTGDKIIATQDAQGKETPVADNGANPASAATPAAPQAAPQAGPQQANPQAAPQQAQPTSPITTGSTPPSNTDGNPLWNDEIPPPVKPPPAEFLKALSRLAPEQQEGYMKMYQQAQTPQFTQTAYGKHWVVPGTGQSGFINEPKEGKFESNGNVIPTVTYMGGNGQPVTKYQLPGGDGQFGSFQQTIGHLQDLAAQGSQKTEIAKQAADIQEGPIKDAIGSATAANKMIPQLSVLQQLQNGPGGLDGVPTGEYADQIVNFKRNVNNFLPGTFDEADLSKAEAIGKINVQIARSFSRELTNRPTQFDFRTFIGASPGLSNSREGQRVLTQLYMASAKQDQAIGQLASKYAGDPAKYQEALTQFYQTNPISVQYNGKRLSFVYGEPPMIDGKPMDLNKDNTGNAKPAPGTNYDPLTKKWN